MKTLGTITGLRVSRTKRVTNDHGGVTSVPNGYDLLDVRVEVDLEALVADRLDWINAAKSGVSKLANGSIVFTLVKRERHPLVEGGQS